MRTRSPSGMPGPWSTTRTTSWPPLSRARTRTGRPPPWRTPFSKTLAKARSSCTGSATRGGRSGSAASLTVSPSSPIDVRAASKTPARSIGSRRGSALPDSSRETSIRFSTRRESRWPSETTASLSSRRSSAVAVGESRAAPAAMIEVSGVRRSWETERSSAVFSSSLRRRAPASIASASIRSRSAESSRSSASTASVSSRRRSASAVRARAISPSELLTTATITKTTRATASRSAETSKRPVGGMWNQLKASALATAARTPSRQPQTVEIRSTPGM